MFIHYTVTSFPSLEVSSAYQDYPYASPVLSSEPHLPSSRPVNDSIPGHS